MTEDHEQNSQAAQRVDPVDTAADSGGRIRIYTPGMGGVFI